MTPRFTIYQALNRCIRNAIFLRQSYVPESLFASSVSCSNLRYLSLGKNGAMNCLALALATCIYRISNIVLACSWDYVARVKARSIWSPRANVPSLRGGKFSVRDFVGHPMSQANGSAAHGMKKTVSAFQFCKGPQVAVIGLDCGHHAQKPFVASLSANAGRQKSTPLSRESISPTGYRVAVVIAFGACYDVARIKASRVVAGMATAWHGVLPISKSISFPMRKPGGRVTREMYRAVSELITASVGPNPARIWEWARRFFDSADQELVVGFFDKLLGRHHLFFDKRWCWAIQC